MSTEAAGPLNFLLAAPKEQIPELPADYSDDDSVVPQYKHNVSQQLSTTNMEIDLPQEEHISATAEEIIAIRMKLNKERETHLNNMNEYKRWCISKGQPKSLAHAKKIWPNGHPSIVEKFYPKHVTVKHPSGISKLTQNMLRWIHCLLYMCLMWDALQNKQNDT